MFSLPFRISHSCAHVGGFALLSLLTFTAPLRADTLLQYNFAGNVGNEASEPPSTVGPNVTASSLTRGGGLGTTTTANTFSSNQFATGTALTLSNADYLSFTITPNSGWQLNLGALTFTDSRSSTGPQSFSIRTSLDSFGSETFGYSSTGTTNVNRSFNFATLGDTYQDISSSIEIRIYGYNAGGSTGRYSLVNSLTLEGTVTPVPEPSTYAAGALAVFAAGWTQRKRFRRRLAAAAE